MLTLKQRITFAATLVLVLLSTGAAQVTSVPAQSSSLTIIRVGDLLTTSNSPGYAMRCSKRVKCVGAIVGKALEPLANGKGVIKVLVMLR